MPHLLLIQHLLLAAATTSHPSLVLGEIDFFDAAGPTAGLVLLSVLGWSISRMIKAVDKAVEVATKKTEETDKKLNEHITDDAGKHGALNTKVENLEKQEDRRARK